MRQKIARFMAGRYGVYGFDKFSVLLLAVYFVFGLASAFVKSAPVYAVLRVLQLAAAVYWFFRLFSKNIAARRKEDEAAGRIWRAVSGFFRLQYNRIREIKTHTYKKCPHCKAVLRLPRRKGQNTVKCPRCGERFSVHNIF